MHGMELGDTPIIKTSGLHNKSHAWDGIRGYSHDYNIEELGDILIIKTLRLYNKSHAFEKRERFFSLHVPTDSKEFHQGRMKFAYWLVRILLMVRFESKLRHASHQGFWIVWREVWAPLALPM